MENYKKGFSEVVQFVLINITSDNLLALKACVCNCDGRAT